MKQSPYAEQLLDEMKTFESQMFKLQKVLIEMLVRYYKLMNKYRREYGLEQVNIQQKVKEKLQNL